MPFTFPGRWYVHQGRPLTPARPFTKIMTRIVRPRKISIEATLDWLTVGGAKPSPPRSTEGDASVFAVAMESILPAGLRRQAAIDAVEERVIWSIAQVVPEHDSAEILFEDVSAFCGDRFRVL